MFLYTGLYAEDYRFIKQESGISIFERQVFRDKKKIRELKAEFSVKGSYHAVYAMITRESNARQWSQNTKKYSVFNLSPEVWNIYIKYGLIWPLNDQDCVLQYTVDRSEGNYHEITFTSTESSKYPVFKGISRIQQIYGKWHITEQNGRCEIIYTVSSGKKINLPTTLTDPIIRNNMIKTFSKFKKMLGN